MTTKSSVEELRRVLPGRWRVHATTFPMWLSGKRLDPTITYTPLPGGDLVLRDEVDYRTRAGAARRVVGTDRYRQDDHRFVWRGRGPLWILRSRWQVERVSADGEVLVITFDRSLVTPAGMDVLGRGTDARPELRTNLDGSGLDADQFSRLTWL
ncbi:hypothetical protein [Actinophytocola oryzae]|nr:hypothetical protein [Actinophytocola oryzae]